MTQLLDYHVHSRYSCDGAASMEELCQAALKAGLREMAITDHLDFEPLDPCYDHFRAERYWRAFERCRATFDGRLVVRAGVECGEPHRYKEEVASVLRAHPYDFVLASIHWVDGRPTFSGAFFDGLDLDDGLALYFDELLQLAEEADYDVLAHVDIYRRATFGRFGLREPDLRRHEHRVRRVLRAVAERGKGIEVNTSYLWKGMGRPGPSVQVLRWFREEGGRIVTLGSDAHRPQEIGLGFDQALAMLREAGFEGATLFRRREAVEERG